MHSLPQFNTYLKIYSKTIPASRRRKARFDEVELCPSTELLLPHHDNDFIDYVDEISLANAMSPMFFHPGVDVAFQRCKVDCSGTLTLDKGAHNRVFQLFMTHTLDKNLQLVVLMPNFHRILRIPIARMVYPVMISPSGADILTRKEFYELGCFMQRKMKKLTIIELSSFQLE